MPRRLDHLVLTTRDRERCVDCCTRVLGLRPETFDRGRVAFRLGDQKINAIGPIQSVRGRVVSLARAALFVAVLAGCAGPLPYRPERQPFGATISADLRVTEDRLRVEIDAEGYRVERAVLVREGDTEVAPEVLVPRMASPGGDLSIGLGGGAAGWGSGGSYSVGTGVGIGLGGPTPAGTTLAVFRLGEAGPAPWRLRVKVVGVEPVDILLDPARPGRR